MQASRIECSPYQDLLFVFCCSYFTGMVVCVRCVSEHVLARRCFSTTHTEPWMMTCAHRWHWTGSPGNRIHRGSSIESWITPSESWRPGDWPAVRSGSLKKSEISFCWLWVRSDPLKVWHKSEESDMESHKTQWKYSSESDRTTWNYGINQREVIWIGIVQAQLCLKIWPTEFMV